MSSPHLWTYSNDTLTKALIVISEIDMRESMVHDPEVKFVPVLDFCSDC